MLKEWDAGIFALKREIALEGVWIRGRGSVVYAPIGYCDESDSVTLEIDCRRRAG